jgi:hypothetical protein
VLGGPVGSCWIWLYYDQNDRVVDAEREGVPLEQRAPALQARFPVGTPQAVVAEAYRGRGYHESSSELRPSDGWYRIEHYDEVTGFYSLTEDWFYYDENDKVLDVDVTHFSD